MSSFRSSFPSLSASQRGTTAMALLLSGGLGYLLLKGRYRSKHKSLINDNLSEKADVVEILLNPNDVLIYKFDIPPVTTLTWIAGSYEAIVPFLEERMNEVLQKNPWLGGRLVTNSKGEFVVEYSKTTSSDSGSRFLHVVPEKHSPLSRSMSLDEMTHNGNSLALSKEDKDYPLWRVSLVPCKTNPQERFALIMSMTHVLGGASTFYSILSMLTQIGAPIESMDPIRIANATDLQSDLFGKEEVEFPSSFRMLYPVVKGSLHALVSRRKVQQKLYWVDNGKMKNEKDRSKEAGQDNVPFVSTNDILVSWFSRHTKCNHVFINVDTKGKHPAFPKNKAGNYQLPIIYGAEDVASPVLIRKSLMPEQNGGKLQRVVSKGTLPSYWQVVFNCHYGMTSNWASFYEPFELPGVLREEFHLPLVDIQDFMPTTFTEMIIFRPSVGKTAVRISGHNLGWLQNNKPDYLVEEEER